MQGNITRVQPFSLHDGPGTRSVVFLKGCNLHCRWCHNPEAILPQPQIQWFPAACIGCGACLQSCPRPIGGLPAFRQKGGGCTGCGACASACYAGALVLTGRQLEAAELVEELKKDRVMYDKSGGGVTFSGGEPYMQADFLAECISLLKREGIHTAVESAVCVPWERIEQARPDLLICDLKSMDGEALRQASGADLELILQNLKRLGNIQIPFWIRVPLIPGFNDTEEQMAAMADFVKILSGCQVVELLPFHNYGLGKYKSLGWEYEEADKKPPDRVHRQHLVRVWREKGVEAK